MALAKGWKPGMTNEAAKRMCYDGLNLQFGYQNGSNEFLEHASEQEVIRCLGEAVKLAEKGVVTRATYDDKG